MSEKSESTAQAQTTEELKVKYGQVYQVDLTLSPDDDTDVRVSYIFKRPTAASLSRYTKEMSNNFIRASTDFLMDNILPEQSEALKTDIEKYPAMPMSLSDKLLTMLGLSKSANLKSL